MKLKNDWLLFDKNIPHSIERRSHGAQNKMAERQGFEPWKGVNPCWFSRPVHSTALPSLQAVIMVSKRLVKYITSSIAK